MKEEIGGAFSTYGGEERCIRVSVRRPEGRSRLEDPGVDGRIILKLILSGIVACRLD